MESKGRKLADLIAAFGERTVERWANQGRERYEKRAHRESRPKERVDLDRWLKSRTAEEIAEIRETALERLRGR